MSFSLIIHLIIFFLKITTISNIKTKNFWVRSLGICLSCNNCYMSRDLWTDIFSNASENQGDQYTESDRIKCIRNNIAILQGFYQSHIGSIPFCRSGLLFWFSEWLNNFEVKMEISAWNFIGPFILTLFITLLTIGLIVSKTASVSPVRKFKKRVDIELFSAGKKIMKKMSIFLTHFLFYAVF